MGVKPEMKVLHHQHLQSEVSMEDTEDMRYIIALNDLSEKIFQANLEVGWWKTDEDGFLIEREVPTLICLMHSELSEAMEADRKNLMDDKLPHRPGLEVELADAIIRILDLAGAHQLDIGGALIEKFEYNAVRADHKLENREKDGGKKY